MTRPSLLHRYTDLAALLDILSQKRLVLLDPGHWSDKNDVHFMAIYKQKRRLGTLLALCFTSKFETYHHWSVFAPGNSGVCIRFKRHVLERHLGAVPGVRFGDVQYKELQAFDCAQVSLEDIPFLKRFPYRDEKEFRAIFTAEDSQAVKAVPFDLDAIDRIVLSPWLPAPLVATIKTVIRSIDGCQDLKVYQTTLLSNDSWRSKVEEIL